MKGMNRIIRGYSFRAVLGYCESRGEKLNAPDGRLIGGNMAGRNVRELIKEFTAARNQRSDIEKTTWHNSLRLPPGAKLDDGKWCEIVDEYIVKMGFSSLHPYCVWAHDDEGAVHIVASRISFDGKVYLGQNENLASTRHIQALEREFGLEITKGPDYQNPMDAPDELRPVSPEKKKLTKREIELAVRTGKEPPRQMLQKLIDDAVAGAPTVLQLVERLEAGGVRVAANVASTGRLNGFAFEIDGVLLKGSDLGKAYGWKGLQDRGVTYEQDRDSAGLERIRAQARAGADDRGAAGAARKPVGPGAGDGAATWPVVQTVERLGDAAAAADARSRLAATAFRADSGEDPAGPAGPERAAVEDRGAPIEPALAKDLQKKIDGWRQQHRALLAPVYRVSLVGRSGKAEGKRINLGKPQDGTEPETFFEAVAVEGLLPQLRRRNAMGFDIYVTPIDQEHHYLVVDDVKPAALDAMCAAGHEPCLVQQSSVGNVQAVLKVPKVQRPGEQNLANKLVQMLNREWGDAKFSGVVHPFRMAAFSNKKPGRANAFTRILEATHRLCRVAAAKLQALREAADLEAREQRARREQDAASRSKATPVFDPDADVMVEHEGRNDPARAVIAFKRAAAEVRAWVKREQLVEDASKIDFRACVAMLRAGWGQSDTIFGLVNGSDRLRERHNNPVDYATRTVRAAAQEASKASPPVPSRPALKKPGV
jgi:hypothetical protein